MYKGLPSNDSVIAETLEFWRCSEGNQQIKDAIINIHSYKHNLESCMYKSLPINESTIVETRVSLDQQIEVQQQLSICTWQCLWPRHWRARDDPRWRSLRRKGIPWPPPSWWRPSRHWSSWEHSGASWSVNLVRHTLVAIVVSYLFLCMG